MKKRLTMALVAGALVAAMLPGVASAAGPKDRVSGTATFEVDDSRATS